MNFTLHSSNTSKSSQTQNHVPHFYSCTFTYHGNLLVTSILIYYSCFRIPKYPFSQSHCCLQTSDLKLLCMNVLCKNSCFDDLRELLKCKRFQKIVHTLFIQRVKKKFLKVLRKCDFPITIQMNKMVGITFMCHVKQ